MSENTLSTVVGEAITPESFNQYKTALTSNFVGRSGATGAPEAGKNLGTAAIPWGALHTSRLYLGGALLDPENIGSGGGGTGSNEGVTECKTRDGSIMPDYLRANGADASFTVLGLETVLGINVGGVGVTVTDDLQLGSLSLATTTNNTALVNDATLTGDIWSKCAGEKMPIALDSVGTEITDREGQYVALKHGTSEIMIARVDSVDTDAATATIDNVCRGYFFDSAGDPLVREAMSDNDTLTLLNLAWVFLQDDGTTLDVSYRTPIWSYSEPANPETDDYWYSTATGLWSRYDGSDFQLIGRSLIGWVVMDDTACIASRCIDLAKSFDDHANIALEITGDKTIQTTGYTGISVYGSYIGLNRSDMVWDIESHLETGLTETADTVYYIYITHEGQPVLSDVRPYDRRNDLQGFYHPYHTWRYVGHCYYGAASTVDASCYINAGVYALIYEASGVFLFPLDASSADVELVGGGAGGGGYPSASTVGYSGGDTTFKNISAGGGKGAAGSVSGAGGTPNAGDKKIRGNPFGEGTTYIGSTPETDKGTGGLGWLKTASSTRNRGGGGAYIWTSLLFYELDDLISVIIGAGGAARHSSYARAGVSGLAIVKINGK